MRGAARKPRCPEGAPLWVVTFCDMVSLLLTFFILMVSFTRQEPTKYQQFAGSVMRAFDVQRVRPAWSTNEPAPTFSAANVRQALGAVLERRRGGTGRVDVELFEDYRGIVLRVGEDAMFDSGRAELRPTTWPFLDDVLQVARENGADVQIEAHTDSNPIHTPEFASNDRLSAARALSVLEYFAGRAPDLPAERLSVVPLGDTHPIAPEATEAGRRQNRRVEVVLQAPAHVDRP
jgi:chemotaxis protein MotB